MDTSDIFGADDWELGQGTIDGAECIVRMRATLPSRADQELFSRLVIVTWRYAPTETGMPGAGEHRQMQAFEDALESGTERKAIGYQVLSLTGGGRKEWRYYAADVDAFIESLNDDLHGHAGFPLEIQSFIDPEWNGLREFLGRGEG